jgi:glycosyltransferase involved in cell wall biosynthesis
VNDSEKLRICLVSREYADEIVGGIGTYTRNMAYSLAAEGHDVWVLSEGIKETREYYDVKVRVIKIAPRFLKSTFVQKYALGPVFSWEAAKVLKRLINTVGLDIVEAPEYMAPALAFQLLGHRRVPVVIRLHTGVKVLSQIDGGANSLAGRMYLGLLGWLERVSIRRADHISSPSQAMVTRTWDALQLQLPVTVYPNPIDSNIFVPPASESVRDPDLVLYTGQLTPRKGIQVFSEVIPAVLKVRPETKFMFVGNDSGGPPGFGSMQEAILSGIPTEQQSQVMFPGRLPWNDLIRIYQGTRVCVFPSIFENFPGVALEAMSCGCTVIGSSSGGMAEIIRDGIDGFHVRPGDSAGIAERILWCLENDLLAMGKAARQRIEENYSFKAVARESVQYFRTLAAGRRDTS